MDVIRTSSLTDMLLIQLSYSERERERERRTEMEGGQSLSGPLATPNGIAIFLYE